MPPSDSPTPGLKPVNVRPPGVRATVPPTLQPHPPSRNINPPAFLADDLELNYRSQCADPVPTQTFHVHVPFPESSRDRKENRVDTLKAEGLGDGQSQQENTPRDKQREEGDREEPAKDHRTESARAESSQREPGI